MDMQAAIRAVTEQRDLDTADMEAVMRLIMTGDTAAAEALISRHTQGAGPDRIQLRLVQELGIPLDPANGQFVLDPAGNKRGPYADAVSSNHTTLLSDFTLSANLAGIPGMSVPCGFSKKGLPIGLQLLGNHFNEEMLLKVAYNFEQATDFHKKKPDI